MDRILREMNSLKLIASEAVLPGIVFWMQRASASEDTSEQNFLEDRAITGKIGIRVRQADDAEALERLAVENGADRILMLVQSPVQALARAMERGEAAGDTLHSWLEGAQAARTVLRRHRRRAVVADAARFFEDPKEVLVTLGLPGDVVATDRVPSAEPTDPVLELIAAEMVREVPGIRTLIGELDASAPVTGPNVDPVDVNVILERYRKILDRTRKLQIELTQARRQAEEDRSEKDAVLRQLLQAQETAEERRKENERLTAQSHKMREKLKSSEKRLGELEAERDEKVRALEWIMASKSYRWTAPLRRVRAAMTWR